MIPVEFEDGSDDVVDKIASGDGREGVGEEGETPARVDEGAQAGAELRREPLLVAG